MSRIVFRTISIMIKYSKRQSPDLVLETVHLPRHVALQRKRRNGKVNARFLENE